MLRLTSVGSPWILSCYDMQLLPFIVSAVGLAASDEEPLPDFGRPAPPSTALARRAYSSLGRHALHDDLGILRPVDLRRLERVGTPAGAALLYLAGLAAGEERLRLLDQAGSHAPGELGVAVAMAHAWTTAAGTRPERDAAALRVWAEADGSRELAAEVLGRAVYHDTLTATLDALYATAPDALVRVLVRGFPDQPALAEAVARHWPQSRSLSPLHSPPDDRGLLSSLPDGESVPEFCPDCVGEVSVGLDTRPPPAAPRWGGRLEDVTIAGADEREFRQVTPRKEDLLSLLPVWMSGLAPGLSARLTRSGFIPEVSTIEWPATRGLDRWEARYRARHLYLTGVVPDTGDVANLYGETDFSVSVWVEEGVPTMRVHVSATRTLASFSPEVLGRILWLLRLDLVPSDVRPDHYDETLAARLRDVLVEDLQAVAVQRYGPR